MIWSKRQNKKRLKSSLKSGLGFGITSAVITTLGLMIGLDSGTGSKLVVLAGVLTVAIADAFSDSLGIHVSQETIKGAKPREVWMATLATFLSKFIFALTFIIPILFFQLSTAIIINIIWGILIITTMSIKMALDKKIPAWKLIAEHLTIAGLVIIISYWLGKVINQIIF